MNERSQDVRSTSRQALSGVRWVSVGMGFQKGLQALSLIVLSRLLTPADFGLVSAAALTLGAVVRIKQLGMYSALIQRRADVQESANTCFAVTGFLSVLLYLVMVAVSPAVADYFHSDRVRPVLNVLALSLLIDAASGIQSAWAIRNMQFRKHSIIGSVETIVTAAASMAMALGGWGVWALVWGSLAGPLAGAVLWWTVHPWRPSFTFRFRVLREMLGFGAKLSVAMTLDGLTDTAVRAMVGRWFGLVPLGFFDFTMRLIQIPFKHLSESTQRVALPAFCREVDNLDRIGRWHLLVTRYSCLLMGGLAVPLVVLADPFIPVIFGEPWRPALPLIRVLGPTMFLMPLLYAWAVHTATTNLNILVAFIAARLVVTSAAFAVAAGFGLGTGAVALLIVTVLLSGFHLGIVKHCLKMTASEMLSAIAPPLLSCVLAGMVMLGVRLLGDFWAPSHTVATGMAALVAGFGVLAGTMLLLHRETLIELRQIVRPLSEPRPRGVSNGGET